MTRPAAGPCPPVACCHCGRVRTRGEWVGPAEPPAGWVSHTICPDCLRAHYPDHAAAVLAAGRGGPEPAGPPGGPDPDRGG
jgi:hypothetical protein